MREWSVPVWVAVGVLAAVVLVVAVLAVALRRVRSRTTDALALARAEAAELRAQVDDIERRLAASTAKGGDDQEYVITRLGDEAEPSPPVPMLPGPLFADLVLRETVVQAASLGAGLRRALAPESRNRIRFEMKREVKRARKQRRADLRQAKREWDARQRAAVRLDEEPADPDTPEDSAA